MTELLPRLVVGLVAGAPLLAAAVTVCVGRSLRRSRMHWPACVGAALSLAAAVVACGLLFGVEAIPDRPMRLYRWVTLPGEGGALLVNLQLDALSAVFLVVSGVATLIVLLRHAATTLADEAARTRFFAGASCLQFATVMLLLAADWLTLFCFWQLTTLAAWLLTPRSSNTDTVGAVSMPSYLAMRTADVLMLIGVLLFWNEYAAFEFTAMISTSSVPPPTGQNTGTSTWVIGVCLFLAAATRCSLFPLTTGRPSARGRCRSASALVESALLMPMGIYLLSRSFPLMASSPTVMAVIISMGAASAVAGALSAAVQTDSRRRLGAAATSLFGLAVLGLGTGTTSGSRAALLLVTVHMLAMTGLWLSTSADTVCANTTRSHAAHLATATYSQWIFAANAMLLCSGIWGQHAILAAVAQAVRHASDPLLGRLIRVAYWCAMASLPCLSFAMMREFSTRHARAHTASDHDNRAAVSWLLWVTPIAAAVVPPLLFGFPGRFSVTAIRQGTATEEIGLASLLTVDVGLPLVLLGVVVAWLNTPFPDSSPRCASRGLNWAVRWVQDGFGLPRFWSVVVGRPLRALAQLCQRVDAGLLDAACQRLPGRLLALPARFAEPLETGQVQFSLLAVLLATALLLLALTGLRG